MQCGWFQLWLCPVQCGWSQLRLCAGRFCRVCLLPRLQCCLLLVINCSSKTRPSYTRFRLHDPPPPPYTHTPPQRPGLKYFLFILNHWVWVAAIAKLWNLCDYMHGWTESRLCSRSPCFPIIFSMSFYRNFQNSETFHAIPIWFCACAV